MTVFNAANWYWVVAGSTTQVFSSASGTYVPITDTTYESWLATAHPSRIASEAELSAVLAQQAPSVVMQTQAGLLAYAVQKQASIASGGISVSVGGSATVEASTDVTSLVLLQGAASIAAGNSAATFQWVPHSGAPVTLTAAQMTTIFGAVSTFLQSTFATLSGLVAAIGAGTVTTKAAVDTPPSPIPAWPANS